jgi:amino acid transporter
LADTKVYARTASGLIRTYSWIDILIYNLLFESAAIVGPFNYQIGQYAYPTADIATAILFWTVPALAFGGMFIFLTAIFPRSGGDYMVNSRTLNPGIGFMVSWVTIIAGFGSFWAGVFANLVSSWGLPDILYSFGVKYNVPWLLSLAPRVTTPLFEIGIGTIAILTWLTVITFLRNDQFSKVMLGFAIFGVIGVAVNAIVLYATPSGVFPQAFNKFAVATGATNNSNYYSSLINSAGLSGVTRFDYGLPFLLTGPIVIYMAMWYCIGSSYITGEVRNVKRNQTIGILLAILLNAVFGFILLHPMYKVQGVAFSAAIDAAYTSGSYALYPLVPMPLTTAIIVSQSPILDAIMTISFLGWLLMFIPVLVMANSRVILAWSFDRLLPYKFSEVDPKYHQPPWALFLCFLIAFVFLVIYSSQPLLFTISWTAVAAAFVYLSLGVSSILVPLRKKEWYQTSGVAKYRIGSVPLLSICGAITIGLSVYVILGFLLLPGYAYAGAGLPAAPLYAGTVLSGLLVYGISRYYRKRVSKIDVDLAFIELSPE